MDRIPTNEVAPETKGRTIRWARFYDVFVRSFTLGKDQVIREMTAEMAQIRPGDKVLDVGCGTGDLTIAAKARAGPTGQLYGTDAAPEMIHAARRKAAQAGLDIDFQVDLVEDISFPDDYFDVVLSSLMMHHLPDDLKRQGLAEIHRVLKPGGHLLVVDFKRPTGRTSRALLTLLSHGALEHGVQDLPAIMEDVGFTKIEVGDIKYKILGFVRGQVSV